MPELPTLSHLFIVTLHELNITVYAVYRQTLLFLSILSIFYYEHFSLSQKF